MDQELLKRLVNRRHPLYCEYLQHWMFLDATYRGGREWFNTNIFKYHKEGEVEFGERLKRAYRFNHTREVVDIVNKYIFRGNIVRDDLESDEVEKFWQNTTLDGDDIITFMKQLSLKSSIYGPVWVVVDTTAKDSANSIADERSGKDRVYAYLVEPQNVLDVSFDEKNGDVLNWIFLCENRRDDADPFTSSGGLIERYKLWTKDAWYSIENTGKPNHPIYEIVSFGVNKLGRVPAFQHSNVESDDKYAPPALINDVAYLDRAIANYCSDLDDIIQGQTFSQLVMPAQNTLGDNERAHLITLSTKRVFTYDGEAGAPPFYLSPDPKQVQIILEVINKTIAEIYQTVGMAGERTKTDNAVGIDNSSGVAKAYDFDRINSLLVAKADQCEESERKLIDLVLAWHGQTIDPKARYVLYPDDFDVRGVYNEFDLAQKLFDMQAPYSVRREQMEDLVKKLWPLLDEETSDEIKEELKTWPVNILETMSKVNNSFTKTNSNSNNKKPKRDKRQGQVTKTTEE